MLANGFLDRVLEPQSWRDPRELQFQPCHFAEGHAECLDSKGNRYTAGLAKGLLCVQAGAMVLGLDGENIREGPRTSGGTFQGIEGSVDSSGALSPITCFPDDLSKKLCLHYPS